MMRVRRLSALFWTTSIAAFIFILYVVMELTLKLPSTKPGVQELDNSKWSSLESKLRHLEHELSQHNAVVEEIKQSVDQIVDQSPQELQVPHNKPLEPVNKVAKEDKSNIREFKLVGEEPPQMRFTIDESSCAMRKHSIPKTDVQMLSLYERISFEDKDGGVWKQGWDIQYNENQWSQQNKLKVFIVPHSHNDPGWLKTFENYYKSQTKAILNNMVEKLSEGQDRKFIWAETSYLYLWWRDPDTTDAEKVKFKNLLKSGKLEIVTGGWVMNDEANSHWLSIVQQLTTGHQWLLDNVDYIPKNSWHIDPFGHSSTQPYLNKLAGFDNALIQRVHYRIKKELALNRQLEFKWRQLWDGVGKTDMFTHMMPFYSYDVPHSCGPDPKVCCQFDFRRLPGNGVTCPWGVAPRKIVTKNVHERSGVILDQWRKKAQLFRSNVLLFPLGDDFRYDRANEWDNQYQNYEMIIDYINNRDEWNTEVRFGTLQDYFKAVHSEVKLSNFPALSGDFFTYADRNQHYWSGYFTSRPFYKSMDRVLLAYVRAAESITALAVTSSSVSKVTSLQLRDSVEEARRTLALFQHHDGITGTSRDEVREDYAIKLLKAIKASQSVVQRAAYYLLNQPAILDQVQDDVYFDVDDIWRRHDEIPTRITIALDAVSPTRRLVLYNSLMFERQEILTVLVSTPHVQVYDPEGNLMPAQLSPVVAGEERLMFSNKYQLSFPVSIKPLALTTYTVSLRDTSTINKYTSHARVRVYNANFWSIDLPSMFAVTQSQTQLLSDITVQAGNGTRVVATKDGLIKALVSRDGATTPVHMEFVQYDSQKRPDNNSGAYLFIPSGPAVTFKAAPFPELVVIEGPYKATLYVTHSSLKEADVLLAISVYDNPSLPQTEVEISSTVMISPLADNLELAIRLSTAIRNEDVFYTDLNGMQMIKRKYFEKLPIQANYYPLPAAAYIEDETTRLTLLTSTPLGVAALTPGSIEVMQDRRLCCDDNRGMNQGVEDNVRTRHTFRVIVENADKHCTSRPPAEHPSGQLSLGAHVSHQQLLQPPLVLQYSPREPASAPASSSRLSSAADLVLASCRSHVAAKDKDGNILHGLGMTFQRVHLDSCYGNKEISKWYPVGDGQVRIKEIVEARPDQVLESTLTHVRTRGPVPDAVLALCPMEVRSVFIKQD
ncbi:alpha-mannosidase 2 [Amyelois transitella]|uniref:alpha-mannosidase 2 n=1 Tax=Amyelois transitella TaxID=680683 RepID=UPI00298F5A61|nr:alpha-mannosidase 2 [Amyelois transitella]